MNIYLANTYVFLLFRAAYTIEQQAMALPPAGYNRSNSFFQRSGFSPPRSGTDDKNKKRSSLRVIVLVQMAL